MGYSIPLNFPPRDVISSQNKNFEHIILWMLNNNPECQWAAFKEEPLNISQSTLSIYLNRLQNNGFIDKARRGYYKITSKGREKFIELSRSTLKDRLLSFPPKVIMKKRNYDHWILWMVYNNTSCKWSDFTSAPLDINQSSLSKNLNMLMDNGLVRKENKEYIITQSGKLEYSQMLRNYDLDRQSILEAEGNRIRELTLITLEFFEKYNINDTGIKFRFLNNVLKLPYDRVKSMVNSSEDFTKILLFISTNHPNRYPKYISAEEFGRKYGIEKITLDYVIHRILTQTKEKPIYPIKFFNLTDNKGKTYYFQEGEKLERILNAIVDDIVNHSYYLHRLYQETDDENGKLSLSNIIEDCINEICHKLFHDDLRDALRVFLPNYLNYLRYQIEAKREFYDHLDKLEGITWQHIPESLQESLKKDKKQYNYFLYSQALDIIDFSYSSDIFTIYKYSLKSKKEKQINKILEKIEEKLDEDPQDHELLLSKAIINSILNRHITTIEIIHDNFDDDDNRVPSMKYLESSYVLCYSYMALGKYDVAIKIADRLVKNYPNNSLAHAAKALVLGYGLMYELDNQKEHDDSALVELDKALSLDSKSAHKSRFLEFRAIILGNIEEYQEALISINEAIEFELDDLMLYYTKLSLLLKAGRYEDGLDLLNLMIERFPKVGYHLYQKKLHIFKKTGNLEEGTIIIDKLMELYPDDPDLLNNKAYWHMYKGEKEEAIQTATRLIELAPDDGNYHDSFGEILTSFEEYEEALEQFKKALELDPNGWFIYNSYFFMGKCYKELGEYDKALETLEKTKEVLQVCFCVLEMREESIRKTENLIAEIMELKGK